MKKLIFVCTGNTCRSPMAEGLLRDLLPNDTDWKVDSAGTSAFHGQTPSKHAIDAMREKGIDISKLESQPLTPQLIKEADLLITMTSAHAQAIIDAIPKSETKVFLLKSFKISKCSLDVCDPFGGSLDDYRSIRDEIEAALPDLIIYMMEHKGT